MGQGGLFGRHELEEATRELPHPVSAGKAEYFQLQSMFTWLEPRRAATNGSLDNEIPVAVGDLPSGGHVQQMHELLADTSEAPPPCRTTWPCCSR